MMERITCGISGPSRIVKLKNKKNWRFVPPTRSTPPILHPAPSSLAAFFPITYH